jgi:hypothetical protein
MSKPTATALAATHARNSHTYALSLDYYFEAPLHELADIVAKHRVHVTHIDPCGPAGGNPCVTFAGSRDNLRNLVADYAQDRPAEVAFLQGGIVPIDDTVSDFLDAAATG